MIAGEWIAIVSLVMFWGGAAITFWVKIQIKLREMDIKINQNSKTIENEKNRLDGRVDALLNENKTEHKEIIIKIDTLIEKINNFQLEVEKRMK